GIAVGMATSIPPHNLSEICDALLHLIKHPNASMTKLVDFMPGPDFPTGGVLAEERDDIVAAYTSGRGGFRVRARWEVEKLKGGAYQVIVTEIPYQVQKSKLIEKIADLLHARKLMMLNDIRDESATEVRLVLEPRNRNVDATVLMESLFRQTDLESRFSLNMNVLDAERTPRVMNLRDVLQAYLDHRGDVLVRRTNHRLSHIKRRLEILGGYLVAYLNLDEVIQIVREEDHPKEVFMERFDLSEAQADAILNMRLRSLRRLEEIEIRKEHDALTAEQSDLVSLLGDDIRRLGVISDQISSIKKAFGAKTEIGRRRTEIGDAPDDVIVPLEALIEREPVTVICSEKGWIRAARGHLAETGDIKYKDGDRERFILHAETTDKILIFATNGRFYSIGADRLPGGRGHGEPLRLMLDLPNDHDIVEMYVHRADRKLLVASSDGRGFVVQESDVYAQTKAGKQVLNVSGEVEARACIQVEGDAVAVVGDNRKLLVFDLSDMPEMARGRGVILQRYKDGGMSDITVFDKAQGLQWRTGERTRTETDLQDWAGRRAQAGRLPPRGFPRNNKFS
ncbi:MAG: DNA gyrase subunit A, partial [Alphaproteobacteria bacterium]